MFVDAVVYQCVVQLVSAICEPSSALLPPLLAALLRSAEDTGVRSGRRADDDKDKSGLGPDAALGGSQTSVRYPPVSACTDRPNSCRCPETWSVLPHTTQEPFHRVSRSPLSFWNPHFPTPILQIYKGGAFIARTCPTQPLPQSYAVKVHYTARHGPLALYAKFAFRNQSHLAPSLLQSA